ncbi:MAG: hypothetical protein QOI95_1084 [Acidimicrobiaceae bacterium]|jgi:hypothetical protein
MGRIGGNVADIQAASQRLGDAGGAATTAGSDAAKVSSELHAQVDSVTNTLKTHFTTMATGLRDQITTAKNSLQTSDWDGTSRAAADAAEADLSAAVGQILDEALSAADGMRADVTKQVTAFDDAIRGQFNKVMTDVNDRYSTLANGATTFASALEQTDQTIRYS